ncbi:hypothetical protein SAMN05421740_103209 [Parapedobacter koreensis]|uniref:Uncharacterized protein n=1 Tax=Parapedobacter koreensis TaxID=332977 RepID=A0A1H7LMD9_9SPHI|nr:hypothetical protein SAMN05421740_103209 [Parapedobacter koreensis]
MVIDLGAFQLVADAEIRDGDFHLLLQNWIRSTAFASPRFCPQQAKIAMVLAPLDTDKQPWGMSGASLPVAFRTKASRFHLICNRAYTQGRWLAII